MNVTNRARINNTKVNKNSYVVINSKYVRYQERNRERERERERERDRDSERVCYIYKDS